MQLFDEKSVWGPSKGLSVDEIVRYEPMKTSMCFMMMDIYIYI